MRILIDYRPALVERTGVGEYAHEMAQALLSLLPSDDKLTLFSSSVEAPPEPGRVPGATIIYRIPVRTESPSHRVRCPVASVSCRARRRRALDVSSDAGPCSRSARHHLRPSSHDSAGTASEIRRDYPALSAIHAPPRDAVVVISVAWRVKRSRSLAWHPSGSSTRSGAPPGALGPGRIPRTDPPAHRQLRAKEKLPACCAHARLRSRLADARSWSWRVVRPIPAPRSWDDLGPPLNPYVRHRYVTDERQRLYRSASMLVVPSLDEGWHACGRSDDNRMRCRGESWSIAGGRGDAAQLVDPLDDEGMAEAMLRILEEPAVAQASIERGFRRARQYSWRASAETLLQAYRQVYERRRTTA